jgi:rubrerythrin
MYNWIYPNPMQLQNSINLIESSVEDETSAAKFYQWLIDNIPTESLSKRQASEIKRIIESIRDDELNHNKSFKKMYSDITGKEATAAEEAFIPPENFRIGIEKAVEDELNAVKKYREIIEGLPSAYYRDKVFNILSDELRHSNLYNFIYTNITTGNKE